MRSEWHVVHLGQVGDLPALGQAAALRDVRHDDVGGLLLKQIPEAMAEIEVFADADGRPRGLRDLGQCVDVLGRYRLFKPQEIQRFEFLGHFHPRGGVIPAMQIDGKIKRRSDALADRVRFIHQGLEFVGRHRPVPRIQLVWVIRVVKIELDRRETLFPHLGGALVVVVVRTVHVQPDPVPELAAQEPVHRDALGLARQVPEGDLDPGECRDGRAARTAHENVLTANELETGVHVPRVHADDHFRHVAGRRPPSAVDMAGFPRAVYAFVCVYTDVMVRIPARYGHIGGLDVGDLHSRSCLIYYTPRDRIALRFFVARPNRRV